MIQTAKTTMTVTPWRKIGSWRCLKCGNCCRGLEVSLTAYEYARIRMLAPSAIQFDSYGRVTLRRIGPRCVFLNERGLCDLQPLGLKPSACKVWPFVVSVKPRHDDGSEARFTHRGEEYYVYLNRHAPSRCRGLGRGRPEDLPQIISEVIEIYQDPTRPQRYSTSRLTYPTIAVH